MPDKRSMSFELFSDEPLRIDAPVAFGADHIIDHLRQIITSCPTPYHIGIFAPWGAGKSTVLEGLRSVESQGRQGVHVINLNAWKYRHDSLRRKFLLTVAKSLQPSKSASLRQQMYTILTGLSEPSEWHWSSLRDPKWRKEFGNRMRLPKNVFLVALAVVMAIGLLQATAESHGSILNEQAFWTWMANSAALLGAPVVVFFLTLFVNAIGKIKVSNDVSGATEQLTSQEQFEEHFLDALGTLGKGDRVIVVVDELDRCAPDQVLEVLETIKTFMNAPGCVFVVACDRDIIENALEKTLQPNGRRAKEYLDKIFQLTVQLPPVQPSDMYAYARQLLELNLGISYADLVSDIVLSRALEVLVRPEVTTPRKVKRLLNDFLVRYSLASRREEGWDGDNLTADLPFLAKMTVLASEFPKFYAKLEEDSDLLVWLDKVRRGEIDELEPYQVNICKEFFQTDSEGSPDWTKPEHQNSGLLRFLGQTWQFQGDGVKVRRHLYLARDPEGSVVGDSYLRQVLSVADSAQFSILLELMSTGRDPDAVLSFLAHRAQLARGIVQANLLLSLLHASQFARFGLPGARVAANALGTFIDVVADKVTSDDFGPEMSLPYIPMMLPPAATKWMRVVTTWVMQNTPIRSSRLFDVKNIPHLAALSSEDRTKFHDVFWIWLQTPVGQQYVTTNLAAFTAPATLRSDLIEVFPRFKQWFQQDKSDAKSKKPKYSREQESVVRAWLERIGTEELIASLNDRFWETISCLLDAYPGVGTEWLTPMIVEAHDLIPEHWAERMLFCVVNCSTENQWPQVRILSERMFTKHGAKTVGTSGQTMQALTESFTVANIESIIDLVGQFWNMWTTEDRDIFHKNLIDFLEADSSAEYVTKIADHFRDTVATVSAPNQAAFYEKLAELVSDWWSDETKMKVVGSILEVRRPFGIPTSSKAAVSDALSKASFADRDSGRVRVLYWLSALTPDLTPGGEAPFIQQVQQHYLSGETIVERFEAGCQAVERHIAQLSANPAVVQSVFDALWLHVKDEQRGGYAEKALHVLLRTLGIGMLTSRQSQVKQVLYNHSDLEDCLISLSSLADMGAEYEYVPLIQDWSEWLSENHKELLADLGGWVLEHPVQVPLEKFLDHLLETDADPSILEALVTRGGIAVRAKTVESLCTAISEDEDHRETGMKALAIVSGVKDKRISAPVLNLITHFLSGNTEEQEVALTHLHHVAPASMFTPSEQERVREMLMICFEAGDDKRKLTVAQALGLGRYSNKQLLKTIDSTQLAEPAIQPQIRELLRSRK